MRTDHTAHPSALILSVKFCDQDTGTNLHTQERKERFSTLHLLASSVWRHLSPSCWCQIYHYQSWYSCACTLCDDVWRSKGGPTDPNNMASNTHIVHHHPTIMMNDRCSFDGCENRPTKHGNGWCRAHGGRTKCNHLGCDSFAQKGGMCRSHQPDQICFSTTGCTNWPQTNGVCKRHGATRICEIHGCTRFILQSRMCYFHYHNSIVCTAINENAMVGEDDFTNSKLEVASALDISVIEASHDLTIMDINDLPFGIIKEYVGMNNWEHAITFAAVCKSWRIAAEPHVAMIGIAPMEGGRQRKLNVTGFLSYLDEQVKLREFMCHVD
jgi:hypothetical protein